MIVPSFNDHLQIRTSGRQSTARFQVACGELVQSAAASWWLNVGVQVKA